ncbi:MAG: hypothetical protein HQK53_00530 [Oligoflexia bacterium]|nr:hypothetical protein [Oligoflexia bacterium]
MPQAPLPGIVRMPIPPSVPLFHFPRSDALNDWYANQAILLNRIKQLKKTNSPIHEAQSKALELALLQAYYKTAPLSESDGVQMSPLQQSGISSGLPASYHRGPNMLVNMIEGEYKKKMGYYCINLVSGK